MTPDEIRNLAIECGASTSRGIFYLDEDELAAYTAQVEAPLQARIAQLEDALNEILPKLWDEWFAIADNALNESPSTWLSEHDKEVEARERERIASKIELMPLAHLGGAESIAKIVRELK